MTDLLKQPHKSIAAYIRALAQDAAGGPDPTHAIGPADEAFLDRLNHFLRQEGERIIDWDNTTHLPDAFASSISRALDVGYLNQMESVFNEGGDRLARVMGHSHNQHLGEFYTALSEYMTARKEPFQVGRDNFFAPDTLDEAMWRPQLWRREMQPDAQGKLKSKLVKVDAIDWSKRPVMCMGGIGCVGMNPAELNGVMRQAEQLLGGDDIYRADSSKDVELYCISYPALYRAMMNAQVLLYNADPEHYRIPFMQDVYTQLFKPEIDKVFESAGDTIAQLRKVMRKWNFYTTSYGAVCVKSLARIVAEDLQKRGLQPDQIRPLLAEVFCLNTNPVARPDDHALCGNFSSVNLVSRNDRTVRSRAYYPQQDMPVAGRRIVPLSDNELLIWDEYPRSALRIEPLPADEMALTSSANIRQSATLDGRQNTDNTGHHAQLVTSHMLQREGDSPYARSFTPDLAQYAMRHAVLEPSMPPIAAMIEPVKLFPYPREIGTVQERLPYVDREELRRSAANENELT